MTHFHTLDTCNPANPRDNCVFEEDGSQIDPTTNWPVLVRVVRRCSLAAHQGIPDTTLYAIATEEQKRRLEVFDLLLTLVPGLAFESLAFTYDDARRLRVTGVPQAQRQALQGLANSRIGQGKIQVS